jgi:Uma2 family endonuclease
MTTKLPRTPGPSVAIPNLDPMFGPDAPTLPDADPMPDAMQQNPFILHVMQILADLRGEPNVFVDTNTMVYYDPTDLNRRVQPDICVAFDVDAAAVYQRNGYVIWEVGKPIDFALEIASKSTAENDTGWKRDLYASLGVSEYWRFDATGGELYGDALVGEQLAGAEYVPFPIHTDPNGAVWGYSPLLHLNLRWNNGRLDLQDPDSGEVLLDRRGLRLEMEGELRQRDEQIRQLEERLSVLEESPE